MRTKQIITTLAVIGVVATFALLNINSAPSGSSFLSSTGEVEAAFQRYIAMYGKSYATKAEYDYRYQIFAETYHNIMNHNMMNAETEGYFMGINKFSDMSDAEFKRMLGYNPALRNNNDI